MTPLAAIAFELPHFIFGGAACVAVVVGFWCLAGAMNRNE